MSFPRATARTWLLVGIGAFVLLVLALVWRFSSANGSSEVYTQPLSDTVSASSGGEVAVVPSTSSSSTTTYANADFGSCKADIAAYCSGFNTGDWQAFAQANGYVTASWKLGLVDCLGKNRDLTSQACDDSLDRRQGLNDDVNTLCATDRAEYCQGVEPKPGSEPQVDCLKEHYTELSATCSAALDAHEAAKPTE